MSNVRSVIPLRSSCASSSGDVVVSSLPPREIVSYEPLSFLSIVIFHSYLLLLATEEALESEFSDFDFRLTGMLEEVLELLKAFCLIIV